jgi:PhzF family phenazine biosynthesis protein
MHVHELRCFGAAPGAGNLALVIENGPPSPAERQAFATARNKAACVFLGAAAPGQAAEADFYYPHARSPLCLHATLAAAHILGARGVTALVTAMRGQRLQLSSNDGASHAGVQRQAVAPLAIDPGLPAHLLGQPHLALASPPLLSSVGSAKLLIEVADLASLHALAPPLARIAHWSKDTGVSGCYVYCRVGEDIYEGRNFNHLDPAREDSATGVAAGALAAWLRRDLVMLQGAALGNPCRIAARVEGATIWVGGATEVLPS